MAKDLLFNRPIGSGFDRLGEAVSVLANSRSVMDRMLARNLMYDHRVSEHCASLFLSFFENCYAANPANAVIDALKAYRRQAAGRDVFNSVFHPGNTSNLCGPTTHQEHLYSGWNVSRFLVLANGDRKNWSKDPDYTKLWRAVLGLPDLRVLSAAIVRDRLMGPYNADPGALVEKILALRESWIEKFVVEPQWWSNASDLDLWNEGSSQPGHLRWFHPAGVDPSPIDTSLYIIFRKQFSFPPSPGKSSLCRPTQLEAGDNPLHCPSSPSQLLDDGGRAMPLTPNGKPPVREYIGLQAPADAAGCCDHGWLSNTQYVEQPETVRRLHLDGLANRYPADVSFITSLQNL